MVYKNEKQILNIIKYSPPIFIISISIIMTFFLYVENQNILATEKSKIKTEYIKDNKNKVKKEVDELYDFIIKTQKETEKKLKKSIQNRVYEAHTIATTIYENNKKTKTQSEIKRMIQNALVNIRFNEGRGYYFIYSLDYECILLPVARYLEGENFYTFKDGKGMYLTQEIIKQIKKEKEGFMSWWYHKPSDMKNQYKKIGFNMYFEPYDWFIGTGEYFVDYDSTIKQEILDYIGKLANKSNDYFFIIDYDKITRSHVKKEFVNNKSKNINNIVNMNNVFEDMVSIAKKGDGFVSYVQRIKPNTNATSNKTTYIKGLQNWEWVIGKGYYEDEMNLILKEREKKLNDMFHENLIDIFSISLLLTLVLLSLSLYIVKILEEKFKEYKKEIQRHLDENTKQHHIVSQQSKMAAMGEMLGNIAHQWRQPLSVITTAASGMKLQREFNTLSNEQFNQSLDGITQSAQYLSKTIDDFRNFFKTDKKETLFSIKDLLERVFKLTESQFKGKNIILIKELEDFKTIGLENEFIQALINIINNAKDALETKEEPRLLSIATYKNENIGYIVIKDSAGGIEEKIMNKIFEPYFTTKHKSIGTGIGLYMTEEIIQKHMNGKLSVKNSFMQYKNKEYFGAEFIIELPLTS